MVFHQKAERIGSEPHGYLEEEHPKKRDRLKGLEPEGVYLVHSKTSVEANVAGWRERTRREEHQVRRLDSKLGPRSW